jgi:pyruvate dehydrogenase E1 component
MLEAVRRIGAGEGGSYLLRLSTRPVDQSMFPEPSGESEILETLRREVIAGCYRLGAAPADALESVHIFAVGAVVPEALEAREKLAREGVGANVFVVTSPDLLHRRVRASDLDEVDGIGRSRPDPTGVLLAGELGKPIVTVVDGHPHALGFLGSALGCHAINLGVDSFGQSGARGDLYRHFRIDADSVLGAALAVLERQRRDPPQGRDPR